MYVCGGRVEMVAFLWADGFKGKHAYFKTSNNYLYVAIVATGWNSIVFPRMFDEIIFLYLKTETMRMNVTECH
jgi:hypothetical protein